ncbi:MAG: nucleotidyltransferase domain-containing protein [Candidatus Woesearchaeota archaeon]
MQTNINDTIIVSIDTKMETKLRIINRIDRKSGGVHIRQLAREANTSYNNAVRNIRILEKENIVRRIKDANLIKISLKDNPMTIAYLKKVHTEKYYNLPRRAILAVNELIKEIIPKPLICLIFGSYARGDYHKDSDIDLLLVFQNVQSSINIERLAKAIGMRNNIVISPIYMNYKEYSTNFLNVEHDFSKEIRNDTIIVLGLEHYYELYWRIL